MGQQQLLLLVMSIVLVALAVVVGISAFERQRLQNDQEAAIREATRVAEAMLAWKAKPSALGGGKGVANLTGLTMGLLGYATQGDPLESEDARFRRELNGVASDRPWVRVTPARSTPQRRVDLALFGPDAGCILIRTWQRVDGTWENDGTPFGVDDVPATCPASW